MVAEISLEKETLKAGFVKPEEVFISGSLRWRMAVVIRRERLLWCHVLPKWDPPWGYRLLLSSRSRHRGWSSQWEDELLVDAACVRQYEA
ncbi:hypothetical protein MLD38_036175 [Melastoma candidum]|nr:hypothetical protein MLD38_036175 [Melastoma candidum]